MTTTPTTNIRILDKEYQVSCPPEERDALQQSARLLDERMRSIRTSGGVIGLERIAVMAALNLTYDLLKATVSAADNAASQRELQRLEDKLTQALRSLDKSVAL